MATYGSSIRVFSSPWLPRPSSFLSVIPANVDANLNVSALLKPLSEGWDFDAVSKHLLSVYMELVLLVPVPGCSYPDRLNYLAL